MSTTPFVIPGYPLTDPRQLDPSMLSLGNMMPLPDAEPVMRPFGSTPITPLPPQMTATETRTDAPRDATTFPRYIESLLQRVQQSGLANAADFQSASPPPGTAVPSGTPAAPAAPPQPGGLPPVQMTPLPATPPLPPAPAPAPAPVIPAVPEAPVTPSAPTAQAPVTSPTFVEQQPAPQQPAAPTAPETPAPAQQPDPARVGEMPQAIQQYTVGEHNKRLEGHSLYANTEKRLAEVDKGKGIESWLPQVIAWAALLQGQPGPLMKLQEQKRQTATMRELAPLLGQVRQMTLSGDYAGANDMLGQIVTLGGQRAPELMPYLMQANKDLEAKQRDSIGTKFAADVLKSNITDYETKNPGKKSLLRPTFEEVQRAAKSNIPLPPDILKEVMTRSALHAQFEGGQYKTGSPLSQQFDVAPVPGTPTVGELGGPMVDKYLGGFNINTNQYRDLLIGQTVQTKYGEAHRDNALGQAIIAGYNTQARPTQADIEIASKNLGIPPELIAAALARGAPWTDVVTRKAFMPGYVPGQPDVYGAGQEEIRRNAADQAMAIEYAKNASDPSYFQRTGQVVLVRNPGPGETFGQMATDQNLTRDQVSAAGDRYVSIDRKKYDELIVPALRSYNDLSTYADFQKAIGNPTSLVARLTTGALREFEKRTGITLSPNATAAAAAEAYVDRAIEQSLKFIPRTDANVVEIGRLKAYIKGSFADTAQGEKAIAYIKQQLLGMMSRELGVKLSPSSLPGSGIGVAPVPAPAVPPRPSAGTAPTRARTPTSLPGTQVGTGSTVDPSGVTYEQIIRDPAARAYWEQWHGRPLSGGTSPSGVVTTPTTPAPAAPAAPAATTPSPQPAAPAPAKPLVPGKLQ